MMFEQFDTKAFPFQNFTYDNQLLASSFVIVPKPEPFTTMTTNEFISLPQLPIQIPYVSRSNCTQIKRIDRNYKLTNPTTTTSQKIQKKSTSMSSNSMINKKVETIHPNLLRSFVEEFDIPLLCRRPSLTSSAPSIMTSIKKSNEDRKLTRVEKAEQFLCRIHLFCKQRELEHLFGMDRTHIAKALADLPRIFQDLFDRLRVLLECCTCRTMTS